MSRQDKQSIKFKNFAKMIVLCTSLSLGIILIMQAQRDANQVVAQDRPPIQQSAPIKSATNSLNQPPKTHAEHTKGNAEEPSALFYKRGEVLNNDYAVELVKDQSSQEIQEKKPTLRLHTPNPENVRHLTHHVVQLLHQQFTDLKSKPNDHGFTSQELSALEQLSQKLKRKKHISRSPFAHTSKSMAPRRRPPQPIPINPQTLIALKKLLELKR